MHGTGQIMMFDYRLQLPSLSIHLFKCRRTEWEYVVYKKIRKIDHFYVKAQINPADFYRSELGDIKFSKQTWNNGGLCPFHDDKRPNSFFIHLQSGAYKCFSCGAKGSSIISFIEDFYGLDFPEALNKLINEWEVM